MSSRPFARRRSLPAGLMCLLLAVGCGSQVTVKDSAAQSGSDSGSLDGSLPAGTTGGGTTGTGFGSTTGTGTGGGTTGTGFAGSTGTGGGGSSGTAVGGSTGTGGATSGAAGGTTGFVDTGKNGQGVTATTIKIGFIGIDSASQAETNALFGVTTPPANTQDATNAIVTYLNAHGGIAGRKIIPYYVERKTAGGDANGDEALCTQLTEDDKVFAVITNSAGDAEPCYGKHHTLLLDDTILSQKDLMAKYNPYIWTPGLVAGEAAYGALINGLAGQGWFAKGAKVGLLGYDDPDTHNIYNGVMVPQLRAAGVKIDDPVFITAPQSDADNAKWAQDIQNTVLKFKGENIKRVMFMAPGAGVPLIFMNQAESQQYHPVYGFSSYDSPGFLLQGKAPASQLKNARGAGYSMLTDVDSQHGDPYPTGIAEKRCLGILKTTGAAPSSRGAAFAGSYLCDGAFMLQAAGQSFQGRSMDAVRWAYAAERLGTTFQAGYSLPNGTLFRPGLHAGGAFYRWLAYLDSCQCFQYTSGNKAIPRI